MVDTLDNVNAFLELRKLNRGDPRVRALLSLVAVTGPYAALGVVGLVQASLAGKRAPAIHSCGNVIHM